MIIECEDCGKDVDEFLAYNDMCYDCSETWFCRICGDDFDKDVLDGHGVCPDCQDVVAND